MREGSALSCEESPKLGNNEKETDSAVAATSSKVALKITAELVVRRQNVKNYIIILVVITLANTELARRAK